MKKKENVKRKKKEKEGKKRNVKEKKLKKPPERPERKLNARLRKRPSGKLVRLGREQRRLGVRQGSLPNELLL